jgi:hypothetical protein
VLTEYSILEEQSKKVGYENNGLQLLSIMEICFFLYLRQLDLSLNYNETEKNSNRFWSIIQKTVELISSFGLKVASLRSAVCSIMREVRK